MAIVYSYPLNDDIRLLDELVGTTKKSINGDIRTVTRNFLLQDLAEFFIVDGGLQKTITLTTDGSSGVSTLDQVTGVLNIPDYSSGGVVPNLQEVTDIGASTTNTISINVSATEFDNGLNITNGNYNGITIDGGGTGISINEPYYTGVSVSGGTDASFYAVNTLGSGLKIFQEATEFPDVIRGAIELYLGLLAKGLSIYSGASSTGNPIEIVKGTTTKFYVNQEGEAIANKFIKLGASPDEILAGDGSVITAGTNIAISDGIISSTGGGGSSPLTTKGDLYTFSTVDARLPIGTDGQILTANSGVPEGLSWQDNYADWTSVVKHTVKNNGLSGTITKGTAVYVTSSNGTNMLVGRASNVSEPTSSKTMGLMQSNITTTGGTQTGFVITEGLLGGLNTAGTTAGDAVWLGVDGALIYGLINKPFAPNHLVFIGIVTKVSAGSGEIFVKVQNGFELKELHDVQAQSPTLKDTLYYDNTVSPAQWKTASIQTILGVTTLSGSNTGDQDLQQVTTKGSLTTVPININAYNDTESIIGLVVASDDITGSSIGANITGSSLGADITGGSNGIVVSGPEAIIIYDSNYGVSVVNPGSIAFTTYIQSGDAAVFNLGTSARGLIINSGTSSVGNVVEIIKEDITKLIINQEGELTATKIIKEGGSSTEYLMADGSISGGGSIQQSLSGTGMTATGGTLPTGTNTHFYRWSRVGDLITVRINLQFQTAGTCSGIAIPFANMPDIPQIPQHPNIYTTALDMITFGSGSLAANKSIGTFTVGSGMSGIRIKTIGTPNTYEIVVGRASGSYNNGWIHVQYYI